jgi:8-oxo-dGTP diphosphatase
MPVSDQGQSLDRYTVVPRTLILSTWDDKLLLIKGNPRKKLWAGLFNGIGGHIEQGEDVLSAAKREFSEETGFVLSNIWLCGIIMIDTKTNPGVLVLIFRGVFPEMPIAQDQYNQDHQEEGNCEWIPFSSLDEFPLTEDLPIILPRILAAQRQDPPFYAIYSNDELDRLVIKKS